MGEVRRGTLDPELAVEVNLIQRLLFGSGKQAGAGPLSTLASGGGVFDNFRSSARRPELGDKPSPVPGVDT